MACVPCAAAAVVGAPVAIPAALAGYLGYKVLSNKKKEKKKN